MKTGVNNLKKGNVILINDVLHEVIDYYNTQPGKGGAFSQIKLRNMDSGSIFEKRFRTSETVDRAHLDDKEVQYLYNDGSDFHFMDNESFEQFTLSPEILGDKVNFMVENCNIMVKFYGGKALTVDLPAAVVLKVTYTEPGVRGDTASGGATKPATLETGYELQVPLFIDVEENIRVDTRTGKYMERAKG